MRRTEPDRKAQPLGEKLFQQIAGTILSGEIALGEEVNEVSLAQRFEVSRGPVREAVRRLQGIGLVSREPYMRARVVSLDRADVLELFQMREALEGMACRLAADHMTAEEADRLLTDLEADRRAWMTGQQNPLTRTFDFHQKVVESSGNRRLIGSLNGDLQQLLRLYRRQSGGDIERKRAAFEEHWQILRAIAARDAELAESMMRSHIARAAANLTRIDASQRTKPAKIN